MIECHSGEDLGECEGNCIRESEMENVSETERLLV